MRRTRSERSIESGRRRENFLFTNADSRYEAQRACLELLDPRRFDTGVIQVRYRVRGRYFL